MPILSQEHFLFLFHLFLSASLWNQNYSPNSGGINWGSSIKCFTKISLYKWLDVEFELSGLSGWVPNTVPWIWVWAVGSPLEPRLPEAPSSTDVSAGPAKQTSTYGQDCPLATGLGLVCNGLTGWQPGKGVTCEQQEGLPIQVVRQHTLEKKPKFQEVLKPLGRAHEAWAVPSPFLSCCFHPHPPFTYIHPKFLLQCRPPNPQTHHVYSPLSEKLLGSRETGESDKQECRQYELHQEHGEFLCLHIAETQLYEK